MTSIRGDSLSVSEILHLTSPNPSLKNNMIIIYNSILLDNHCLKTKRKLKGTSLYFSKNQMTFSPLLHIYGCLRPCYTKSLKVTIEFTSISSYQYTKENFRIELLSLGIKKL